MENNGYIYILTNPSFQNYIQLGSIGSLQDLQQQIDSQNQATPFAYQIYAYYKVDKKLQVVENAVHFLIDKIHYQLRAYDDPDSLQLRQKGFIAITAPHALQALQEVVTLRGDKQNLTISNPTPNAQNDNRIAQKYQTQKSLQSTLPLSQYGLQQGDKIIFLRDSFYKATVQDDNTVVYNSDPYTLDDLAKFLTKKHYNWHTELTVPGSHFFTYNDKILVDILQQNQPTQFKQ